MVQAVEGPLVPVEAVWSVLRFYRNTPEAVQYVCTELDAGRVPDGLTGPSEGVPVPQVLAMTPEGRCVQRQGGNGGGVPVPLALAMMPEGSWRFCGGG